MRFERLGNIIYITKGKKQTALAEPIEGAHRYIQIEDLRGDGNLKYTSEEGVSVNEIDLIIAWDGANAGTIGFGLNGMIGSTLARLRVKDAANYSTGFLGFFLKSKFNYLRDNATGATIPHISKSVLEGLKIPVLPIIDQQKIANLLSRAETLLTQRKESLKLLDVFLESTFYEMFGDPGENEKEWEKFLLEDLVSNDCPLAYGIVQPGEDFPDGVPIVRPVDLTETFIKLQKLKRIDPSISSTFKRTILKGGEILICVRGTTGLLALASEELRDANVTRGIVPIWFDESYNKWFAFHLLRSFSVQKEIRNLTYGATLQQINLVDLRRLKLICPPLDLQLRFASIAEKVQVLRESLSESLGQLENLLATLNQNAFDGELNLDKLSARILEASVEEKASIGDELDITIIKAESPKQEIKSSPYQTLKPVAGKVVGYKPKADDLLPFIQQSFGEDFFTFPSLKDKAIEAGWSYDFEQLKTYVFDLLREGKLQQVFTDAAFEERMKEVNEQYQKPTELTEKLHLQRALEL